MHTCELCNYITPIHYNLKIHMQSKKHIIKQNNTPFFTPQLTTISIQPKININGVFCQNCNKPYPSKSSFYRHVKICKNTEQITHSVEIEQLKKDHEHKLEIERIKNESLRKIEKIKYENELKIKDLENKTLQQYQSQTPNVVNNNTIINNTINISKIDFLNLNFGNVIDIKTFIENYNNDYGLTNEQTQILLENYESDGINGCITSLVYYLKQSAIKQYKEIKGKEISIENIILPFLLSDKSLREHFEKSINGKWDKTTMVENIKKIITITNDMIYKHHNKYINLNGTQKKRLINGVLKASGYACLSQISVPNLYKIENSKDDGENEDEDEDDDDDENTEDYMDEDDVEEDNEYDEEEDDDDIDYYDDEENILTT